MNSLKTHLVKNVLYLSYLREVQLIKMHIITTKSSGVFIFVIVVLDLWLNYGINGLSQHYDGIFAKIKSVSTFKTLT